ncbi:MAG: dihydroorotate dehydrogenase electron transfer subunit [Patescibacteria group bacterium]|nr:dihydroorotate dehydrogenase electron transfer subunit [Patescibacteria group bacterium]
MLHCTVEQPIIFPVKKIINEAPGFKTFIFEGQLNAKPGQFVMFWIPKIEARPFSVSFQTPNEFQITVMKVGEFTKAMFKLKPGDKVGIQGPYGRPFSLGSAKNIVILGGGCGIAPVFFLLNQAVKSAKNIFFIGGCRSKDIFLKQKALKKIIPDPILMTDDGSLGKKGFTTDALERLLKKRPIDKIFACGPEIMLLKTAQISKKYNIPCQISLERLMKCGIGICGQCCLDDCGLRVCHEGPVFEASKLLESPEFGKYKRDNRGKIIKI